MKCKIWLTTKEAEEQGGLDQETWRRWARTKGIIPANWVKKVKGRWFIHKDAAGDKNKPYSYT